MNDESINSKNIIFISFGSYATNKSLAFSQMLAFADGLHNRKVFRSVTSVIFFPLLAVLARARTHKSNLRSLNDAVSSCLYTFYTPLQNGRVFGFIFRRLFLNLAVKKMHPLIENLEGTIILHCRSYYSADFAIRVKKHYIDKDIKIVFDSRSLLAQEFPYTMGFAGRLLYVAGKEWERDLFKEADISLVVTKNGIRLLELEGLGDSNVKYIPISGLSTSLRANNIEEEFAKRWSNSSVLYCGTIGLWYSLESIERTMSELERVFSPQKISLNIATSDSVKSKYNVTTVPHKEMSSYYRRHLAVLVPGTLYNNHYVQSLKMATNFFSTKASEALSLGVPLLVNSEIYELANLVTEKRCGVVFTVDKDNDELSFVGVSESQLCSREFWLELTLNAFAIGHEFSKENVESIYMKYWKSL